MSYSKAFSRAHNAQQGKRWDHTIIIGHLHAQYKASQITLFELCQRVAKLIGRVKAKYAESSNEHWELDEIEGYFIWDQEDFEAEEITRSDYNLWLSELYDWGDFNKRLWIDSITQQ